MDRQETPVLVVGAGPTGLTAANLLGRAGVPTLVVERDADLADLPRAVSIDDEAMRALQAAGLADAVAEVVVEGTGTRYYAASGRPLAYARGPVRPRFGHAVKNPMDQPEFDRVLLGGLERFDHVRVAFSTRLAGLEQDDGGVVAALEGPGGERSEVRPRYVLACDGGRSAARSLLGIEMDGSSFPEPWIVIDTIEDPHDQRYAMHHGDPARPHVIIPGRDGRCRYEFLLLEGETAEQATSIEFVRRMLAPYRTIEPEQITRCIVYQFHALVARAWRRGGVFLLGDAAHMMPPFAGQGLNTGLRDAFNLAWKVAAVLDGRAGDALLDTYEAERRPHAQAMIALSERLGRVMMTTSPTRARVRDAAMLAGTRLPLLRRYVGEMRFKPAPRFDAGLLLGAPEGVRAPVGEMLVQPKVLLPGGRRVLLDEVLGDGFALLAVDLASPGDAWSPRDSLWAELDARTATVLLDDRFPRGDSDPIVVADADGALGEALDGCRGSVLLVRPDRYVAGCFRPGDEAAFAAEARWALGLARAPAPA